MIKFEYLWISVNNDTSIFYGYSITVTLTSGSGSFNTTNLVSTILLNQDDTVKVYVYGGGASPDLINTNITITPGNAATISEFSCTFLGN